MRVRLKVRMCVQGSGFRGFRAQGVQGSGFRLGLGFGLPNASSLSEDGVDLQAHYDLHVVGQRTGVIEKSTGYRLALSKRLATYPATTSKPMKEPCLVTMIKAQMQDF